MVPSGQRAMTEYLVTSTSLDLKKLTVQGQRLLLVRGGLPAGEAYGCELRSQMTHAF